ncbi:MAG: DNA primase [Planctomycetes bacterium]|nr:DNA primase [Planctomycetota bacterium]
MAPTDLQDAKEQVRQAIDIVDLTGSYMQLRRQGRGYVALCPWHDDSRPSLQVNPDRQSFKCWVCDIGGDIFSFIMRMEGLEFREALEMLAERAGVELSHKPQGGDGQFDRRSLLRVMAWAEQLFHRSLLQSPQAEPARRYLIDRGITDESIKNFQLGFAPQSWDWLLQQAQQSQIAPEVLERVGLVRRRDSGGFYDYFRGRVIFSIRDVRSRAIGFGGRFLPGVSAENDAKYLNSPETPLFSKSNQLYALDLAREGIAREKNIVVMEGYTDVIMAHQHGVNHAVAVLGTALGERHVPLVRRFTDSITLVLDGDEAGQKRTMQILDDLLALFVAQEIDLQILTLPQGTDPCDVIASQGSDAFRQLLSNSLDALEHKIQAVTNGLASAPGTHRSAQAVEEILGTLARAFAAQGSASSASLVREQQVMSRLSRQFGISEEILRSRLVARRREQTSRTRSPAYSSTDEARPPRAERLALSAWEKELIELLLHQPEVLPTLVASLPVDHIENEFCRQIYQQAINMMESGQEVSFERLMLATDDSEEKNLLVECDEQGLDKQNSNTEQRVSDLLTHLAQQQEAAHHQLRLADLKQRRLDPEHEQEVLSELFEDFKRRQTGSSPTDG